MKIVFTTTLLLCFLLLAILLTPLHYWTSTVNTFLIQKDVQIETIDGHFWKGKAQLSSSHFTENFDLEWQLPSITSPIRFQLVNSGLHAIGEITPSFSTIVLNIDALTIESEFVNFLLQKRLQNQLAKKPLKQLSKQSIRLVGAPIEIEKLLLDWPYRAKLPSQIQAQGYWDGGHIYHHIGLYSRKIHFDGAVFELVTNESGQSPEPHFTLRSKQGKIYMTAKIKPNGEGEATIMTALLKAVGQPWYGSGNTPAFVMTERIF